MKNQKIRVSVVEDLLELRESIKSKLDRTEDMEWISEYEMGELALTGLVKDQPDVVLMDIGLPGMNGIEVMLRVKRKMANISFLMFTVYKDSDHVFDALKAGASGYVLKQEGPDGIVKAIREILNGGAPMSREIARKVLNSFSKQNFSNHQAEKLSPREIEILNCLMKGWLYKEIAGRLVPPIAEGTVKQHIHRIYKKLEVNNRTEAINKYLGKDKD